MHMYQTIRKMAVLCLVAFVFLGGCGKDVKTEETSNGFVIRGTLDGAVPAKDDAVSSQETAFSGKSFVITLYPETAPITCENFEELVEQGFYNGLSFHRVVDGFMAQGGDPTGTGSGGSGQQIKGEFSSNGVENTLSHQRGVVSMARSGHPDSASSQFFICYDDWSSSLDGMYAAFGKVTEGMEVVDSFLTVPRSMGGDGAVSAPDIPIVMREVSMLEPDEDGNPRVQVTMK